MSLNGKHCGPKRLTALIARHRVHVAGLLPHVAACFTCGFLCRSDLWDQVSHPVLSDFWLLDLQRFVMRKPAAFITRHLGSECRY